MDQMTTPEDPSAPESPLYLHHEEQFPSTGNHELFRQRDASITGSDSIALCLSGGGFRAAIFHLGALRRLNERGLLSQVESISCVSGGSIIGAWHARMICLGQKGGSDGLHLGSNNVYTNWDKLEEGLFAFVRRDIRSLPVLAQIQFWQWGRAGPGGRLLQQYYDQWLGGMKLRELPDKPYFIFCATDLIYANCWASTQLGVGDYMAGYVTKPPEKWTVGKAVTVSSCFPPVFAPVSTGISANLYARPERSRWSDSEFRAAEEMRDRILCTRARASLNALEGFDATADIAGRPRSRRFG